MQQMSPAWQRLGLPLTGHSTAGPVCVGSSPVPVSIATPVSTTPESMLPPELLPEPLPELLPLLEPLLDPVPELLFDTPLDEPPDEPLGLPPLPPSKLLELAPLQAVAAAMATTTANR